MGEALVVIASPYFFTPMKTAFMLLATSFAALAAPQEIEAELGDFLKTTKVKGASMLWISEGQTSAWQYGYSDAKGASHVDGATRFRAGSVSKLATAVIALRASEAGKLSLDDAVEKWLPGILDGPKEWRENVTLAQLLEHTAGLPGSTYAEYAADTPDLSPTDYVLRNSPFKLRWEPGIHYSYANSGATILGAVLEKAYGLSFDEIASKEVFVPLGMTSSDFSNTTENLSACFDGNGNEILTLWEMPVRPAGSLVSTPQDLEKLMRMLLARGKLPDGTDFLSPASVLRMEAAATSIAAKNGAAAGAYGLGNFGFVQNSVLFRGHWGRTDGFQTNFGYLPAKNSGFILMVNGADRAASHGLRKILAEALTGDTPAIKPAPLAKLTPPPTGLYVNFSHDMPMRTWLFALLEAKRIRANNNGLVISSIYPGSSAKNWTEVAPNLYQADGVPVPTSTFHSSGGKNFWIDGESHVRRSAVLVYGEISILLLASFAAMLSCLFCPWIMIRHRTAARRVPAAALLVSGISLLAFAFLFREYGLMGTGSDLGKISAASIGLLAANILLPLGSAIALFMRRSPISLRLLSVPLLAASILLAIHGWIPLITFSP